MPADPVNPANPANPAAAITPFANESESLALDELTIENRLDQVSLYGAIELTRDKPGLAAARQLKSILDAVVAALEADPNLPDQVPRKPADKVDNPFGS